MAAATQDRTGDRSPGEKVAYTGASGYRYYANTLIMQSADIGALRPLAAAGASGAYFVGVNDNRVDLTAGLGSSQAVLDIWKMGVFTFAVNGTGTSLHIGRKAFGIDDQTVGVSGALFSSLYVGEIVDVPTSSTYRVRINSAVGFHGVSLLGMDTSL